MAETKNISQIKQLSAKRFKLMEKVHTLDSQINSLLAEIQVKKAVEKQDYPKAGSGPSKLCKAMSSRPNTKEAIAKKTGLSIATVTLYLHQYHCFKSAGRGKGYIYLKPKAEKR